MRILGLSGSLRAKSFNSALLLASMSYAMLMVPAIGQTLPKGMTMHRVQAGEPDASGWMVAASTEGGFSVRMPIKFNDFTLVESDPKAPTLRTFTVGAKSQEGIKLSATRIVYRKGAESAKHFFARFEKGLDLGSTPERVKPHSISERRAVDLVLKRKSDVSYQRAVLLEADLLLLIVESPRIHEATAQEVAAPFFDSLVVSVR
jgi:hypothetical protein